MAESPVQQLIKTVLGMREIRAREEQVRIQGDMAAVDMLGRVGEMASQGLDPSSMLAHTDEWAQRLDISPEAFRTFIGSRVRTTSSVRDELVGKGAEAVAPEQVASTNLTGQTTGALTQDEFAGALAEGATGLLS